MCDINKNNIQITEAFIAAKYIEGCSGETLYYYGSTIKNMFGKLIKPITDITTDDMREYLTQFQRERGSSKVTLNNMRRVFSSFFNWLEEEDYIKKSPMRRIKNIKTDKVIKETIRDEALEQVRDACDNIRDIAIIDLLASTGMRLGELVGLDIKDINFNERECIVFGKGAKERQVYFDARANYSLKKYLESRTDDNTALFVSLQSPYNRLSKNGIGSKLRAIGDKVGVRIHPHKFRRTFATKAIDKGMPIEQVQSILGHVQINTTTSYAMVNQTNVKNSHRKYMG